MHPPFPPLQSCHDLAKPSLALCLEHTRVRTSRLQECAEQGRRDGKGRALQPDACGRDAGKTHVSGILGPIAVRSQAKVGGLPLAHSEGVRSWDPFGFSALSCLGSPCNSSAISCRTSCHGSAVRAARTHHVGVRGRVDREHQRHLGAAWAQVRRPHTSHERYCTRPPYRMQLATLAREPPPPAKAVPRPPPTRTPPAMDGVPPTTITQQPTSVPPDLTFLAQVAAQSRRMVGCMAQPKV